MKGSPKTGTTGEPQFVVEPRPTIEPASSRFNTSRLVRSVRVDDLEGAEREGSMKPFNPNDLEWAEWKGSIKPFNPKPRFRPHQAWGLLAIAGALGAIALATQPAPVGRAPIGGRPLAVASPLPMRPNALRPVVVTPSLRDPEVLGPTDRCVIEAPQVDDRFAFTAPRVDDRFVLKPLVQGLPVSSRSAR
ncbi:hypothetical protein SAMN05444166_3718 [Singulisphaera sp. GP187]|uniref:hypothetical protein n=1 Tax=Singulisphaera sp. GP187 TaxID=1882752 RepID=UPI00092B4848|nr:hypothetical protein [Singulisphaera sp. GP187]SIO31454.1 hypothetical protein SAMN05444166_3718 [Singulisphaera sp. GP187]